MGTVQEHVDGSNQTKTRHWILLNPQEIINQKADKFKGIMSAQCISYNRASPGKLIRIKGSSIVRVFDS